MAVQGRLALAGVRVDYRPQRAIAAWLITTAFLAFPMSGQALTKTVQNDQFAALLDTLDGDAPLDLYLELVINGMPTGRVVPVIRQGGALRLEARYLRESGVNLPSGTLSVIDLTKADEIEAVYHQMAQRIEVVVPADWLPRQRFGGRRLEREFVPAVSDNGVLLGYNGYAAHEGGQAHLALWHEGRVFGGFGTLSTTGSVRAQLSGRGPSRYIRYDSHWRYYDEQRAHTYEAGDLVTRTLAWNGATRLAGIQFSRDFSVRPDIITYPIPAFAGSAGLPSTAELFINGHQTDKVGVQPGPFTFDTLPYVNGAGEAVIVVTDMDGRQSSSSFPFYVSAELLRPGLSDYAVAAGLQRRKFGLKNFAYGDPVATASIRMGLTAGLTGEAAAEATSHHMMAGAGGVLRLGRIGMLNLSGAVSQQFSKTGYQLMAGYRYTNGALNLMANSTFRTHSFGDLSTADHAHLRLPTRQIQTYAGYTLGGRNGSIGLSYFESRTSGRDYRLATLSYYRPIFSTSSVQFALNRSVGERRYTSASVQLLIPLGGRAMASAGVERTMSGKVRAMTAVSRSAPADSGIGWSAATVQGDQERYQADLTWKTQSFSLRGGVDQFSGRARQWAEVSGAFVAADGAVFAANRVTDSFVLVKAAGVADVPVKVENMKVGATDAKGRLLVPWITSFYPSRLSIDATDLPYGVVVPEYEKYVSVMRGGGRVVNFGLRAIDPQVVVLVDTDGKFIEAGADVTTNAGAQTWVGHEGQVYLEDYNLVDVLKIVLPDGSLCSAQVDKISVRDQERRHLTCR